MELWYAKHAKLQEKLPASAQNAFKCCTFTCKALIANNISCTSTADPKASAPDHTGIPLTHSRTSCAGHDVPYFGIDLIPHTKYLCHTSSRLMTSGAIANKVHEGVTSEMSHCFCHNGKG